MKNFLLFILISFTTSLFGVHKTKTFLIQFATNQHDFDITATQKLEEVVAFLKQNPNATISLVGRTDFEGTNIFNLSLSKLRTNEVADFIKNKKLIYKQLSEKWVGETIPISNNTNENGRALNRSVEIIISIINYENTEEWIQEKQSSQVQTFNLNKSGINILKTNHDAIITIPDDAFVGADGIKVDNKNIKLCIKEVNSNYEAILHQVFTLAGAKILETGGMINIEAYKNLTPLNLAADKEIEIKIPTKSDKNDMYVFEGVKDNSGAIDWVNTGKQFATNEQISKVSIKLNEIALLELIDGIDLKKPSFTNIDFEYKLPVMLNIPWEPTKPKMPEKPEAEQLFSWFGWMISTPQMKENRVQKVHKKNMDDYQSRMNSYNIRLDRYHAAEIRYKDEFEKFRTEKELFYDWLRNNRTTVQALIDGIYDFHDKTRTYRGLKKLYENSKASTQYCKSPLKYLRNFARTTRLTDEETIKIEYLVNLKKSIATFLMVDYETLVKKYSKNGKLAPIKMANSYLKNEIHTSERLWKNQFLDQYIIDNKETFLKVFSSELGDQLMAIEKERDVAKVVASRNYFTGNTKKMGWINCDRYIGSQLATVSFNKYNGAYQAVILSKFNSIISTVFYTNSVDNGFAKVPLNEKFKLITLRVEGDQAFISIEEAVSQTGLKLALDFKKLPIEEIDKVLASL